MLSISRLKYEIGYVIKFYYNGNFVRYLDNRYSTLPGLALKSFKMKVYKIFVQVNVHMNTYACEEKFK